MENLGTKNSLLILKCHVLLKDAGSHETLSYIGNVWVVS